MSGNSVKLKYDDTTPPSASASVVLFTSFPQWSIKQLQSAGIKKVVGNITCDEAGTLRLESSHDGTTWVVVSSLQAVASPSVDFDFEYLVEHYDSFRLVFTNGITDQTVWHVNLALTTERAHSKNGAAFI